MTVEKQVYVDTAILIEIRYHYLVSRTDIVDRSARLDRHAAGGKPINNRR